MISQQIWYLLAALIFGSAGAIFGIIDGHKNYKRRLAKRNQGNFMTLQTVSDQKHFKEYYESNKLQNIDDKIKNLTEMMNIRAMQCDEAETQDEVLAGLEEIALHGGTLTIMDKYKDICKKTPKEAAKIVGEVDKRNYLAHTIRDIEFMILTQGKDYHIGTWPSVIQGAKSKIFFRDNDCQIRLTYNYEERQEREIRLILAHELGHLIYNINKLKNPETLSKERTDEEEIYAWTFAFYLINKKSDDHNGDMQRGKFVYHNNELQESIYSILKGRKISTAVMESLST